MDRRFASSALVLLLNDNELFNYVQWPMERLVAGAYQGLPVTRDQARAIEQLFINNNPQFRNEINSIAPTRSWYDEALNWAEQWNSNRTPAK